jgi:hypothetical protein
MATLNAVVCAKKIQKTGFGECWKDLKMPRGAFKVPKGKIYSQTELDSWRATLQAGVLANSVSNRIFPLHGFRTLTDNSEETVMQTFGDGSQIPVRNGNYRWTFQYIDGGLCLSKALDSHNFSGQTTWLFYDDDFSFFGYRKQASDGSYGLAGVPLIFHAMPFKVSTGAEVTSYRVYFDIKPDYLNKYLGFIDNIGFDPTEITGLQNIVLQQTGVSSAGVVKIKALVGCDYSNIQDLYPTELASTALWIATNATTGNVINIASVAMDSNTKSYVITLSSSDPDYPSTSGGLVDITLVGPTDLDAADISGFEGNTVQVQRG